MIMDYLIASLSVSFLVVDHQLEDPIIAIQHLKN